MQARTLWDSQECGLWATALAAYPAVLAARGERLPELDRWYSQQLPALITARRPPHVTRAELVQVAEWKMKRGVYRARNLMLAKGNSEEAVVAASGDAFARADDPRGAVQSLAALSGVGPATASAVLAAFTPERFPFFDEDVAAVALALGAATVKFTLPFYLRYAETLRERARVLAGCPGGPWTADSVGRALWCAAALE